MKKVMIILMLTILMVSNVSAQEDLILPGEAGEPGLPPIEDENVGVDPSILPMEDVILEDDVMSSDLGIPLPPGVTEESLAPSSSNIVVGIDREESNFWYYVLGGIGLIVLILIGYKYFKYRKEHAEFSTNVESINQNNNGMMSK